MPTTIYRGCNLNWGTLGTGSCTLFGNCKIQTTNETRTGDEFELRDEVGDQRAWVGYGVKRTATFEYYVATNITGSADGKETVVAPIFGALATITNVSGDGKEFLTGSMVVKNVALNTSNTDAVKVSVEGTFYPYITN